MFVDMRGVEIKVGDRVVYGKSDRDNPIKLGTITDVSGYYIKVLGDGNTREGELGYGGSRVLVLPSDY